MVTSSTTMKSAKGSPRKAVSSKGNLRKSLGATEETDRLRIGVDARALDVLFSRYRHVLSLVAYRILGNHAEAEDAVQNCLLIVSDNVSKFEHEGAFRC
jgi:hypothetical protein